MRQYGRPLPQRQLGFLFTFHSTIKTPTFWRSWDQKAEIFKSVLPKFCGMTPGLSLRPCARGYPSTAFGRPLGITRKQCTLDYWDTDHRIVGYMPSVLSRFTFKHEQTSSKIKLSLETGRMVKKIQMGGSRQAGEWRIQWRTRWKLWHDSVSFGLGLGTESAH